MKILFVSLDTDDLWIYEYFRDRVKEKYPTVLTHIVCGERKLEQQTPRAEVEYVFNVAYRDFVARYRQAPLSEIITVHVEQANYTHSSLYRSDLRYVYGSATERELALEQAFLVERAKQVVQAFQPDLIFMSGGGQLQKTAFFSVGERFNARCYRISPADFANPINEGIRYWFLTNDFGGRSSVKTDKFDYPAEVVRQHVERLINLIRIDQYKLDAYARSIGTVRANFEVRAILRDIRGSISFRQWRFNRELSYWRRLKSLKNYVLNRGYISRHEEDIKDPFFLFPLNIYDDTQLIVRAPQYRDMLSLTEQVANVLPFGHKLVVKEHPAHLGMVDYLRLRALLHAHPNIVFVSGKVRMTDLLPRTAGLVTINNTSGFEALVNDKPVVVLGEVFYKHPDLTYNVENPMEMQTRLTEALADPKRANRQEMLISTVSDFIRETIPTPGVVENRLNNNYVRIIAEGIIARVEKFL